MSSYFSNIQELRVIYKADSEFVFQYLKRYSNRESVEDFANRRAITPIPAFATTAVDEIKNAIFQRIADVVRTNVPDSYLKAVSGDSLGVDRNGSTMAEFIGKNILPELLIASRVGICIDSKVENALTQADVKGERPYCRIFKTENILETKFTNGTLTSVTLSDDKGAFSFDMTKKGVKYTREKDVKLLNLKRIPFVLVELPESVFSKIAMHQVALLNIGSTDVQFICKSNFTFYVEQKDSRINPTADMTTDAPEAEVGVAKGRFYGKGLEAPQFINPSSEPLLASMKKQEQLKEDIRKIAHLTISSFAQSAEGKNKDGESLEAGLSFIGLTLQNMERNIANIWADYEFKDIDASIFYPAKYSLKTEQERFEEAEKISAVMNSIPSITFKRECAKQIASSILGVKVASTTLNKIFDEIDKAEVIAISVDEMMKDIEAGLVSPETASKLRGYPSDEYPKAKLAYIERLKQIAAAQQANVGAARGIKDVAPIGATGEEEKEWAKTKPAEQTP